MGISGYMIACIVVIIFVVLSIFVLVFVIRWRRKKRKESNVDVPTQSNRPTREQTARHESNANSDDVNAPRITPSAPLPGTLRSHTDYDMYGTSNYSQVGGNTGHDYTNHFLKPIETRQDQSSNYRPPKTDDRYSISMIYPSEAVGDYASPYSHRDHGSDNYEGGYRNSGNFPSYDTRAPSPRYREPTRSNRDERYANTPLPYDEYEMETNHGYDTYGDSTPRRSYYDVHPDDLKTISATAV